MPPAPPRFSTTIGWPSSSVARIWTIRVIVSGSPPAAYGTIILMGRLGKSCATALDARSTWNAKSSTALISDSSSFRLLLLFHKVYCADGLASPDPRLLGLRPHARAHRRPGARRRHRPGLSHAAGRGDLLPDDAVQGIRLLGDVALLVHRVAEPGEPALHRDPGVPFALLPPLLHLRLGEKRHPPAGGAEGQAHRRPRVPDDRAGVDP